MLAGRYRLVAPIGVGACATVYLAEDQTLARAVAVKVLHDVLAADDAFLSQFRDEARAAGALTHPHVTAVFDWGESEVPFLVMEYLSGGSLRRMLDVHGTLSVGQTLVIGLEGARGLDYAHQRGFVHRDIKPANLLFDGEGRLRIADFGLARALAEASSTEPTGAVMGTAKYASPEQAKAEKVDGRSDVYSLALVMVEALTGTPPFLAETSVATLMARVERPIPVDASAGPLQSVLTWAGHIDPAERPDASEFASALLNAASQIDRPEPLPIADLSLDAFSEDLTFLRGAARVVVETADPHEEVAPPATVIDEPPERAAKAWGRHSIEQQAITVEAEPSRPYDFTKEPEPDFIDLTGKHAQPRWRKPEKKAEKKAEKQAEKQPEKKSETKAAKQADPAKPPRRWLRRTMKVIAVVAGLALVATAVARFAFHVGEGPPPPVPVPELTGKTMAEVQAVAAANGWKVDKVDDRVDDTPVGQVLAQTPVAGTPLAHGAPLQVRVSAGPPLVPVPTNLVGKPLDQAKIALFYSGFVLGDVQRQDSDQKADVVLSLGPNTPQQLPKGAAVPLVVSSGKGAKSSSASSSPSTKAPTTTSKKR